MWQMKTEDLFSQLLSCARHCVRVGEAALVVVCVASAQLTVAKCGHQVLCMWTGGCPGYPAALAF